MPPGSWLAEDPGSYSFFESVTDLSTGEVESYQTEVFFARRAGEIIAALDEAAP